MVGKGKGEVRGSECVVFPSKIKILVVQYKKPQLKRRRRKNHKIIEEKEHNETTDSDAAG